MDEINNAMKLVTILLLSTLSVQASPNTNVVVMLGDSTTLSSRSSPGAKLTDCVQSYLTEERLQVKVVNSGAGGDTARGGFGRLQRDVFAHDPAVVTISFGLNDTGYLTPDEFRECMENILQSIQKNSKAKILLITSTPFVNDRHVWGEKFRDKGGLDEYMDSNICIVMRTLAKKYKVPICDLHTHFADQFKKTPKLIDDLIREDGVHLTEKGNKIAADQIAPLIAGLLKPENDKKGVAFKTEANAVPFDASRPSRTWTAQMGSVLEASLLRTEGGFAYLKDAEGTERKVPIGSLIQTDQAYLLEISKNKE